MAIAGRNDVEAALLLLKDCTPPRIRLREDRGLSEARSKRGNLN